MVHPYLRRRDGRGAGRHPLPDHGRPDELKAVLQHDPRRAAVPGTGDADRHRRRRLHADRGRCAAPRHGDLPQRGQGRGVPREVHRRHGRAAATRRTSPSAASSQIEGFGSYGFPESHAASFALLVYARAWVKCHHPAVFAGALLNSQPMGFYAPAQIVRDAREHRRRGARRSDVTASDWDCTLEPDAAQRGRAGAAARPAAGAAAWARRRRSASPRRGAAWRPSPPSPTWRGARGSTAATLEALAQADAFRGLGRDRRAALWDAAALSEPRPAARRA